jgi:methylated-DNA-protein-cysteine methyltransferase-like protein
VKRRSQPKSGKRKSGGRRSGEQSGESLLEDRRVRVVRCIRAVPTGKVSSYGAIAKAAGWPGAARQVVRILQQVQGLPWHRVLGSGGAIKLGGENAAEQRFRLRMEGVTFRGMRVDMKLHEFHFAKVKLKMKMKLKITKPKRGGSRRQLRTK